MKQLAPFDVISLYAPHDYTLKSLFETRARSDPSRPFLIFGDKTWSWGEFNAAIDDAARMLVSRGVGKGGRVGIVAANSDAHVLLLFAAARIGAILVPVNPELS